jgi:aspartate-semialdehyde dehydrogenase
MPLQRDSQRIVIAGASSLLGAELKSLLEESRFAGWEMSLVDEEIAAGTLTEAGGEPAVIQPVEEGTFDRARFIFFTGSGSFTASNIGAALSSGAKILDLSGSPADRETSCPWFPELPGKALDFSPQKNMYTVLSAPAVSSALLAIALRAAALRRLAVTHFRPISEAGQGGIAELERQTSQLLSFQPIGKTLFDTQTAFNLLNSFGRASRYDLTQELQSIRSQVSQALGSFAPIPLMTLLHAPVFYGSTFIACAELDPSSSRDAILDACAAAGFDLSHAAEPMGNISSAGQDRVLLATPQADTQAGIWWFWGVADNVRLPAWNAVKLAEKLGE